MTEIDHRAVRLNPPQTIAPRVPIEGVVYRDPRQLASLVATGAWAAQSVGELIRAAAREHPSGIAVRDDLVYLTWQELDQRSDALAVGLVDLGLAGGDRVLVQLDTDHYAVVVFAALFKIGIVPVCAVPRYRDYEMSVLCDRSGAVAHLVSESPDLFELGVRLKQHCPSLRHVLTTAPTTDGSDVLSLHQVEQRGARQSCRFTVGGPTAADVMALQLSGGTTGVPKMIPRFHGEYVAYCAAFAARIGLRRDERMLWSLPISHNAGMILVLVPCFVAQATMVLQRQFDVDAFLRAVEQQEVNLAGSIGPIAAQLLRVPDPHRYDLSTMRYFFSLNMARDLESHLKVRAGNIYGITEGLLMACHPDDPPEMRHQSIGTPVSPFDRVQVLYPGREDPVPPGDVGELCFTGPAALTAYVADAEATEAAFSRDGLVRTGDLVRARTLAGQRGYSFEGRSKENIDRGGEKFGTEELEALLSEHPQIIEARIVGMPDPILGERVCAFLVHRSGNPALDIAEVGEFLLQRGLAKFKLPERLEYVDRFPVTKVGKLDRAALRRLIADKIAAEEGGEPVA